MKMSSVNVHSHRVLSSNSDCVSQYVFMFVLYLCMHALNIKIDCPNKFVFMIPILFFATHVHQSLLFLE